jgi:signal transduction histidine kinase
MEGAGLTPDPGSSGTDAVAAWRPACPAEAVARLPWLAPAAESLVALARLSAADAWPVLRLDPGATLLLLRQPAARILAVAAYPFPPTPFPESALQDPALIEEALRHLEQDAAAQPPLSPQSSVLSTEKTFVDWGQAGARAVHRASLTAAHLARQTAVQCGRGDPEQAWVCGLLAPLGWQAVCAVSPEAVTACLEDPAFARDPTAAQRRHWGLDHAAVARRLARRWRLPDWLAGVVAHLGLPAAGARRFGADPVLLALTRVALRTAREHGLELGLVGSVFAEEDEAVLGGSKTDLSPELPEGLTQARYTDPAREPLLADLLRLAAEVRRLRGTEVHRQLEAEVDTLHAALEGQARGEAESLRAAKLTALAELAAGAGHEINNPLAVIAGQAQYLLAHRGAWFAVEAEAAASKALDAILAQTWRIHGILRDLMQFARPAPPRPAWLDLPTLLGEVAASVEEAAAQRQVRLEVQTVDRLAVYADAEQLRLALGCLLRNAVEAAPAGGWARLRLPPAGAERVAVAVEDSGPGPAPAQRGALFDPFYSGRSAGRGRGLGLPVAWRLARQQGGDVALDPTTPPEPTRFVLSLPRTPAAETPAAA